MLSKYCDIVDLLLKLKNKTFSYKKKERKSIHKNTYYTSTRVISL